MTRNSSNQIPVPNKSDRIIFDFSDPDHMLLWVSVNDVIMGGVSTGEMKQHTKQTACFSGTLSLDNDGGFSSVRTIPAEHNLSAYDGLALTVKGDGRSYKLNLTDGSSGDKVLFQAKFNPPQDRWEILFIPFEDFIPTFRGRRLQEHPALDMRTIRTFGLMISEKQTGEFSLQLAAIAARSPAIDPTAYE